MRKTTVYLIILIAGLCLASCSDSRRTYKIGVAQCSHGPWRDKVNQEMLAAQHLYDETAEVCIAQSYDDTQLQIRQIDSLASAGIDLLVVAPNETEPLTDAIARVRKKGIPVIYFDRKAQTEDYTAFIGGNNVEAGQTAGNYVIERAKKSEVKGRKPRVVEITGLMSSSPARERHEGFKTVMASQEYVEYTCREADWTSDKACEIAEQLIGTAGQPDIIFTHNDGMATGVYKAMVERNVEGQIEVVGIDGLPGEGIEYVQFGHQVGSYVYPTHGELIVKLALDILTGRPYQRDNELQGMMVTPENADLMAMNSRELIKQNQDLIIVQDKLEAYFGLYNTQQKIIFGGFIAIAVLLLAVVLMWIAIVKTRRALHDRQAMNEEQTLFYTNSDSRTLRQVFETPMEQLPQPKTQDAIFAETLNEAIRQNMSNPQLKMDDLGETVGLGRVQLYRKVKAITGLTPVELLRQMRLQHGYVLLTTTTKTVQEIAYEVGFGTPGYFSKCFRQQYGKYPMELRENKK
ncbi:MAG: substrate-binding domain-containing protein [Prevotella sp.]|nr:substrate-binding domain-containing protein [Prevotella sp.]